MELNKLKGVLIKIDEPDIEQYNEGKERSRVSSFYEYNIISFFNN